MTQGDNAKSKRSKNWVVVLYPESAPKKWRELIEECHIEWIQSPLHDSDLDADGEPKKAHYHILLMFGSLKSYEQVREIADLINCPSPQRCHNVRAMVRYMAHLDNPDKAQYDILHIEAHGGVDLEQILKPNSSERYSLIRDMIDFVREQNITEYEDLMDYAAVNQYDDWFPLLCDNASVVMQMYIKSKRHRGKSNKDYATGEILE